MSRTRLPGTPSLLRVINDRAALELLLERGPLTRAQLGTLTGLSKVTASQLVERLEERELVARVGELAGGRGPNAQLYAVVPSCAYVVGVHVGPTSVVAASADITGRMTARVEISTDGADDPVGRVHTAVTEAAKQAGAEWGRVRRVVLGTPGVVDPATGDIAFAFDLPQWHRGLRDALSSDLERPVSIENDVNLAAIAEARLGAAAGVGGAAGPDFALFWLSRGVGLATVLGGRLHRGAAGAAGEIGYLYVPGAQPPDFGAAREPNIGDGGAAREPNMGDGGVAREPNIGDGGVAREPNIGDGWRSGNPRGLRPAFQQTISEAAVRELAAEHGFAATTAAEVVAAAVAGGAAGEPVLDELARRVALGVVAVVVVLDPSLVVIAGDVGSAGGAALAARVEQHVTRLAPVTPRVVPTGVPGEPVLRGALITGLDAARDELFG